jgi:hypothetical protein
MVLNIDAYLKNRPVNRVERIGIEIEGGWTEPPAKTSRIIRDGSVKNFPKDVNFYGIGEVASPPIPIILGETWLNANYPQYINKTCGLHVHMSFADCMMYGRLMHIDYHDTVVEYLKRWATEENIPPTHTLWDRLNNKCEHCQHKFWPDKQARQTEKIYDKEMEGHRYTVINYCYGLRRVGGTVEVRVLPMFDSPEQSWRAIMRVIDITNGCLIKLAKKENPLIGEVKTDDTYVVNKTVAYY